jgi:3-dehydroquinate synthase
MDAVSFIVAPGESSKSFSIYEKLTEDLARSGHQRTDLIIALGGGVVGDLAGFTASSYMRGVPFVQVPTSLLAQIDSSVGGKTGINIRAGKNLVGAVYQPKAVLIDPLTLDTLPIKYLRDGIGEALKYGFIDRPDLLDIFEDVLKALKTDDHKTPFQRILMRRGEIIEICCESKRDFVIEDERDFGKRMILNYGHTIGHAIEKLYGYKTYTHGEAVAMGMYFMQGISEKSGKSEMGLSQRLKNLLVGFELYNEDMKIGHDQWMDAIAKDKKNLNNMLNVIFVEKPGTPVVYGTTLEDFQKLLKEGLK